MAKISHTFLIHADREKVFAAVSSPTGLDAWWTKRSAGQPRPASEYELWFGPTHNWRAKVSDISESKTFELLITKADSDWRGSRVRFDLRDEGAGTRVDFTHSGWPKQNDHYRISTYCWAMYLRLLKRYVEHGEKVAYERRLEA